MVYFSKNHRRPLWRCAVKELSDRFHPLTIHAEVRVSQAGGGADMDYLLGIVDVKLRIIDKTKDGRGKLGMNIMLLLCDDICPLHTLNYGQKSSLGLGKSSIACILSVDWEETQFGDSGQGINFPSVTPMRAGRLPAQPTNKTAILTAKNVFIILLSPLL